MRRSTIRLAILGAVAALVIAGVRMTPSWAYFTANSEADGGHQIRVKPSTTIEEEMEDGGKQIQIVNNEDSAVAVYTRVRIFANEQYLANGTPSGEGWTEGSDGYWYYTAGTLAPGESTSVLEVKIEWPLFDDEGEAIDHSGENFNVIVVYESTPEQYKNGELVDPMSSDCDWDMTTTD